MENNLNAVEQKKTEKLKRKYARCIIVSLIAIVVMCPGIFVLDHVLGVPKSVLKVLAGIILIATFTIPFVWMRILRCPHCKQGFAPLRWNPGVRSCCMDCGKIFVFDDEIDPEEEEERSLWD
jgi:hypothetical protein